MPTGGRGAAQVPQEGVRGRASRGCSPEEQAAPRGTQGLRCREAGPGGTSTPPAPRPPPPPVKEPTRSRRQRKLEAKLGVCQGFLPSLEGAVPLPLQEQMSPWTLALWSQRPQGQVRSFSSLGTWEAAVPPTSRVPEPDQPRSLLSTGQRDRAPGNRTRSPWEGPGV